MNPLDVPLSLSSVAHAEPPQPLPARERATRLLRLTGPALRMLRSHAGRGYSRYRRQAAAVATPHPAALEREHLAQFLHDQLGGLLVQLRLAYGAWRHAGPAGDAARVGDAFDTLLAELSGKVRRLTFALAPPEWHDGLLPALESVAAELGLRSGLAVQFDGAGLLAADTPVVPVPLRAVACRVVRELGLNVIKHAQASRIELQAAVVAGQLCIRVQDDGIGLPAGRAGPPVGGLGLRSARAQLQALGGSLALVPGRDGGTCAVLRLPMRRPAGAAVALAAGARP